jgi:hypothetical protein
VGIKRQTLGCYSRDDQAILGSPVLSRDDLPRATHKSARLSVASPNSLHGSMGLNGLTVGHVLREQWPQLVVTETHPQVLYLALAQDAWAYGEALTVMNAALLGWLNLEPMHILGNLDSEHKWDALVSAFAVMQGVTRNWQVDLHRLPTVPPRHGGYVQLLGFTNYFWPHDVTQVHGSRDA